MDMQIPGSVCPVPCCHVSRARAYSQQAGDAHPESRARTKPAAGAPVADEANNVVLQELDRYGAFELKLSPMKDTFRAASTSMTELHHERQGRQNGTQVAGTRSHRHV